VGRLALQIAHAVSIASATRPIAPARRPNVAIAARFGGTGSHTKPSCHEENADPLVRLRSFANHPWARGPAPAITSRPSPP
jgi:hypothetical protein